MMLAALEERARRYVSRYYAPTEAEVLRAFVLHLLDENADLSERVESAEALLADVLRTAPS